jgi:hypothetical protein
LLELIINLASITENFINFAQCDGNLTTPFTDYLKAKQSFEAPKNLIKGKAFTFPEWTLTADTITLANANMFNSYRNNELFLCDLVNFVNHILLTRIVPIEELHDFENLAYINAVGVSLINYVKAVGLNSFAGHYACSTFARSFVLGAHHLDTNVD